MSVDIFPHKRPATHDLLHKLKFLFQEWSEETFAHGGYPQLEMNALADAGLLTATLPGGWGGDRELSTGELLEILRMVGQGNLSVGRIYEGHVNALLLIEQFATPGQREGWYAGARERHLFGVWNTEMADGVTFTEEPDGGIRVTGSKSFCSGSVQVTRPIVTGRYVGADGRDRGWQMAVLPLDNHDVIVDPGFWTTYGMRNSVSYKIDFTGIRLGAEHLLGEPDDYNRQPTLTGGAVRFAAVQLGGAEAVLQHTRDYLRATGRTTDAHQRRRVGEMTIAVESSKLWLPRAGQVLDHVKDASEIIAVSNMVRCSIADTCRLVLNLSDQCVGARGMLPPQPLSRLHADLQVYLRQPAPDATLDAVGQYVLRDAS